MRRDDAERIAPSPSRLGISASRIKVDSKNLSVLGIPCSTRASMGRSPTRVVLTVDEREELERRARRQVAPHREVLRAKIILALAAGRTLSAIAQELGTERYVVRKWGRRFASRRIAGLEDKTRSGRPARFSPLREYGAGEARMRAA
jgi:hypothetical protein